MSFKLTSGSSATIFDVAAEETLRASLKPAWDYVCRVATLKYPYLARRFLAYSDEVYALVLLLVEEHSLRTKCATTTESFYDICRESTASPNSFFHRYAKWLSVLSVVALPYAVDKLERCQQRWKDEQLAGIELSPYKKRILLILPVMLTFTKWLRVLNYARYLFKFTGHAVPLLRLLHIQLKYCSEANAVVNNNTLQRRSLSIRMLRLIPDVTVTLLSKLAPLVFYSLQFMDMFYDEETGLSKITPSLPVPPPPPMPKVSSKCLKLPASRKQCPLCSQPHRNPTTLPASGFVFCYTCLHEYVSKHACCPVTYRACTVQDMIRIHMR